MINQAGQDLIKASESLQLTAYLCQAGVPTIGWGTTKGVTLADVKNKLTITQGQADAWFLRDLALVEDELIRAIEEPPTPNQFAAMVSLAYNIGTNAFKSSSVLKFHNRHDFPAAKVSFGLWNKVTDPKTKAKVVSNGLTTRRAKEASLYALPGGLQPL